MPLGSVEEWRARIGSSWCALGRPVKSVSSGGVTRPMSGEIMLQVLYVLMMLTLVMVLQRLRKMNKSLSDYHKELRSNIHPRTAAKRLLFIMILLLQVQSFIQSSLLLRCGDIESNPGPGLYPDLDYNYVDNSTVLIEDDFRDVYREVVDIQTTYYQFGVELGLPPRELDAIRKQFVGDLTQCFTEVLLAWLRHRYKVDRHGLPTWRRLVEAVDSPSGGNDHALAKAIASKHPSLDPVQTKVIPTKGSSLQAYEENIESNHLGSGEDYDVHINGCSLETHEVNSGPDSLGRDQNDTHTECMHGLSPPTRGSSRLRALIQKCQDALAAYYQRQVDERAWPPIKATNFINLALIKDQTSWHKTVQESVDQIVGDKENTSYYDMLNDIDKSRFILLEGRPGCGKTTLMNKISRDWSNGKILKSKLLIFVPLRRLNHEPDRKLSTIIRIACPNLSPDDLKQLVSSIKKDQGKSIVFAFDGLDEYKPIHYELNRFLSLFWKKKALRAKREDLFDLIQAKSLQNALVILSSRPIASKDFRQYAGKRLEVLGFLKPQVIEYVYHYFDNDREKAQQLLSHLEQHPNLMNMAYLPLHCAMLVFLFEDGIPLPETETEFYKHFTLSTLVRSLRKRNILKDDFSLSSFSDLPCDDKRLFDVVCQLAFEATIASKQVFTYSELKHKLLKVGGMLPGESGLGFIVIDRYFMRYGLDETYTFLHLTFQEYLAAVHIAGFNEHKLREFVKTQIFPRGNSALLSVVWRFLCGMLDYTNPNATEAFQNLMARGTDPIFKFQCSYESQQSSTCIHIIRTLQGELKFTSVNLSPSDCTAIGFAVQKCPDEVYIIFQDCDLSYEGAFSLFQHIAQHQFSLTLRGGTAIDSCLESLKQCPVPGLLSLNLGSNRIGDTGAQALGECLKHCTNLRKLNLSGNHIGRVGARAIGESLKHCVFLLDLDLHHNIYIDDIGCQGLGEGLKHCTKLTKLDLGGNSIEDDGARAIGNSLKFCVDLHYLNLSGNNISGAAIQKLSHDLKDCTRLSDLNLSEISIGPDDVPHLLEMLQTFESLKKLSISKYYGDLNSTDLIRLEYVAARRMIELDITT